MGNETSRLGLRKSPFRGSGLNIASGLGFQKIKKHRKVLILSLDAAGKTSFLYRVKTGELPSTIPTIGYNHEVIEFRSTIFDLWDVGGQDEVRKNWGSYFYNAQAVIFVVDSNDRERLDEVRHELNRVEKFLCENRRNGAVILLLANKQDLPDAMSYHELHSSLFQCRSHNFHWELRTCCNKTGDGVIEALEWLHKELKKRYK